MADLAVTCPSCGGSVNIPIEAEAATYTCPHCSAESPIQDSLSGVATVMKDPLIGSIVSECEVEKKVGEGGFGAVYKAFDRNLQRPVALKVMLQSLTSNLEFVQKFIREAVTAAQLNHPNIVAIHKVGRDEDRNLHFLIMEFLDGRTLSEIIEERGALPLDECIAIIIQCADALAVAQDKNIIHRDIKPENLMMDRNGVVKITDFGLAKTLTTDMKSTKVVGTPHFMSPEQFEGKAVDGRTDIYSLGVTFYNMLTQAKPYEGTNTVQIIYSILTQDPKPASEINPDIPEEVWRIIRRMIAKDVKDRYADFREVRRDLQAYQERSVSQKVSCPECNAVNVKGRKFCRECGGSLVVKCPGCGHEEPAGTRHCGECGTNIGDQLQISQNLDRGEKLRGFGDLKRALAFYAEVLKLDPAHETAEKATREIRLELEQIEERKTRIDDLVKEGNTDQALEEVETLLLDFPKVEEINNYGKTVRASLRLKAVDAHLMVAEAALDQGRMEDAIEAYEAALSVDPERDDVRDKVEDLRQRLASFAQSLVSAEAALGDGRWPDALRSAKELLQLKPEHERAMEIHEEAKAKVASIDSFVSEGREFLDRHEYDEAISRFETALDIVPGDENVKTLLAAAKQARAAVDEKLTLVRRLLAENKAEQAKAGAEQVLSDIPGHSVATGLLADAEEALAELSARQELDRLVERGREQEKAGDLTAAVALYEQVLAKDPNHAKAANLKAKIETRLDEGQDLKKLADEHMGTGDWEQAAMVLNQLTGIYPQDEGIRKKADLANANLETIEGGIARATDALRRKRFDLVAQAADEVLLIAPDHGAALAAKKDAERGIAGIGKQLEEARELIDSELFDDALAALDKAEDRGATEDQVAPIRQAAEDGKMVLLKSDATRSFVFKDFEKAIETYEEILKVDRDDPDAKKGIRSVEKAIVSQGRENWIGKAVLACLLVVLMVVVQFVAVDSVSGTATVVKKDPEPGPEDNGGNTPPPPPPPPVEKKEPAPDPTEILAVEKQAGADAAGWSGVKDWYAEKVEKHPDDKANLEQGAEFTALYLAALETPEDDHPARLAAYREALGRTGKLPGVRMNREEVIDAAISETVLDWIREIAATESGDYAAAEKAYGRILEDEAVTSETALLDQVGAYRDFARGMADAEGEFTDGNFEFAYEAFQSAATNAGEDDKRRKRAEDRREEAKKQWVATVVKDIEEAAVSKKDSGELYLEFADRLRRMEEKLDVSAEEVMRLLGLDE